ncbi:MAG: TatD family hydrolase, partial [Spirochaetaceae bacterium]|nr:TatD family hydrolase [Spirochaetaceae bacterium]
AGAGARGAANLAAIGEAGLDYHHDEGPRESQRELFAAQVDLAARLGLPAIVHSREAAEDSLAIVREASRRGTTVVMHCFGYGAAWARAFLDAGCYLSFAGNITYKTAGALREACALVPIDRLLFETDSPYMNPMPLRGRPSSPRDLERTVIAAAELRSQEVDELAQAVAANALRLFGPTIILRSP